VISLARLGLLALLLATAPAASEQDERSPGALMDALMWGKEPVGGPFALPDQHGRLRTDEEFRGKLLLLYFGYTRCPDVCPADVLSITLALQGLGARAAALQPIFVTLDPERDTAEHLADYLESFDPRWIGLTGDKAAIQKLALDYKIWFAKAANAQGDDYSVDHTSAIFLVGRDGKYIGFLPPGTEPGRIGEALRAYL
jgi:protein SCO1/2